jgi:hypothetical protein
MTSVVVLPGALGEAEADNRLEDEGKGGLPHFCVLAGRERALSLGSRPAGRRCASDMGAEPAPLNRRMSTARHPRQVPNGPWFRQVG